MTLIELKNYLKQQCTVDLLTLTQHFNVESDIMRDMLEHWIRKGKVRKTSKATKCCEQCYECDPLTLEIYEWVE